MESPTLTLLKSSQLIKQGAEAKVYKSILHPLSSTSFENSDEAGHLNTQTILLKHRFQKQYRHPALNSSLTKSRVAGEARALMKCLRTGVRVPGIRMVDASEGILGIEWIEGKSVRVLLGSADESDQQADDDDGSENDPPDPAVQNLLVELGVDQSELMLLIGAEIAKMHTSDVIHGDLTTSNMMLRRALRPLPGHPPGEIVLIDFGLSFVSALSEDKAVDLYVLERAFASTHPDSDHLFALILEAYATKLGKDWKAVGKKLDEVRMRGRKRSMVG